jgi:hypothetical protein
MSGGRSWSVRIRSVRMGPLALPTAYTEERYGGQSLRMVSTEYSVMPSGFDAAIKSMRILCAKPTEK